MNGGWLRLSLCAMLLGCMPGCLIVRQSTQIVRDKEPVRMVRFESEQAERIFETGAHQMQAIKGCASPNMFAIPFLCLFIRGSELSDNAVYNDQVGICDVDGDNLITFQEAMNYRAAVDMKVAAAPQNKSGKPGSSEAKPDGAITVTQPQQKIDPPPALIHISSNR